jgi:ribosomal-protein-alanine N-acetyltransferase
VRPERPAPAAVRVRPAEPRDVPAVAAIEQASFGDPWSANSFAQLVHNPGVLFAIAEQAGAVAGYVVAWFAADEAEVANVAVAAVARGRGVGAQLLDVALTEAAGRGAATVYLEVRESNGAARRLYASRGFAEVGRRRRYYRNPVEDALVLARPLAPPPPPAGARNAAGHRA